MKLKFLALAALLLCVFPVLAQDSATNSVTFNGFSFNFDSSLATNVAISQFPGDAPDLQQPGGPEVRHTRFLLDNDYPVPEGNFEDMHDIRVYNTADFAGFEFPAMQLQQLQDLLAQRPDLASFMTVSENASELPFMPVMPASQVIRSRVQFVDTTAVSGVSYVTIYRQDVSPFMPDEFIYTFQGISADGTRYVSAIFNLTTELFPSELPADFDLETFSAQFNDYLTESIATLNAASPDDFTPSLTALDTVIQSISFTGTSALPTSATPAATETVESGDPTMGGLAGVTCTLVSYGSPDAPTLILPEAPITATFSEQGISGSAGCNTYNGPFQFANGTLTIGPIVSTEIACADAVNAQEIAYLNALVTASSFQVANGQLLITYDGGVLTFRDALLVATSLEGNWTLVSYGSADAPTPVLPEAPITLTVAASQASGSSGCNQYSGTVQIASNTVAFGELVSTLMACAEPIQTQETAYLDALRTASAFQVANSQLQITYASGVLTFTAAS